MEGEKEGRKSSCWMFNRNVSWIVIGVVEKKGRVG